MEKYDITKPIKIPVGMHKLNDDPSISFQLNRLVNMDGCDLAVAQEIGPTIKTAADFYDVLKKRADLELENEHIKMLPHSTECPNFSLTGKTRTVLPRGKMILSIKLDTFFDLKTIVPQMRSQIFRQIV